MKLDLGEAVDARVLDILLDCVRRSGHPPQVHPYTVPFQDRLGRVYPNRKVERIDIYYPVFINQDESYALDYIHGVRKIDEYYQPPPLPGELSRYKMFRFFVEE